MNARILLIPLVLATTSALADTDAQAQASALLSGSHETGVVTTSNPRDRSLLTRQRLMRRQPPRLCSAAFSEVRPMSSLRTRGLSLRKSRRMRRRTQPRY
jgi:hypothetical protein